VRLPLASGGGEGFGVQGVACYGQPHDKADARRRPFLLVMVVLTHHADLINDPDPQFGWGTGCALQAQSNAAWAKATPGVSCGAARRAPSRANDRRVRNLSIRTQQCSGCRQGDPAHGSQDDPTDSSARLCPGDRDRVELPRPRGLGNPCGQLLRQLVALYSTQPHPPLLKAGRHGT